MHLGWEKNSVPRVAISLFWTWPFLKKRPALVVTDNWFVVFAWQTILIFPFNKISKHSCRRERRALQTSVWVQLLPSQGGVLHLPAYMCGRRVVNVDRGCSSAAWFVGVGGCMLKNPATQECVLFPFRIRSLLRDDDQCTRTRIAYLDRRNLFLPRRGTVLTLTVVLIQIRWIPLRGIEGIWTRHLSALASLGPSSSCKCLEQKHDTWSTRRELQQQLQHWLARQPSASV